MAEDKLKNYTIKNAHTSTKYSATVDLCSARTSVLFLVNLQMRCLQRMSNIELNNPDMFSFVCFFSQC